MTQVNVNMKFPVEEIAQYYIQDNIIQAESIK